MKRFTVLGMLILIFIASNVAAQRPDELVIGIVAYEFDALVWPVALYEAQLEADLDMLPVPPQYQEERLPIPESDWDPLVDLVIKEAATPSDQVSAIEGLLARGVDGIVIAPASGDSTLKEAIQKALNHNIPVIVVHRDLPGIASPRKAYVGVEHFKAGYAIGRGALGVSATGLQKYPLKMEDRFAIYIQDPSDPLQTKLAEGFAYAVGDHLLGQYVITPEETYERTTALIEAEPMLTSIFLTDPTLIAGTLRRVEELATPGDHIRIVSFGAPSDYKTLIANTVFNGAVSQDFYGSLLKVLVQLKAFILNGVPLQNDYVPVELRLRFHLEYGTFTRYPYENPFGFDLLFMWWFG